MNLSTTPVPDCYGKSWDANDIDCKGGYNPTFRGEDGTRIQPKCEHFDSCRSRVMSEKVSQAREAARPQQHSFIPAASLLRPYGGSVSPPTQLKQTVYSPPIAYQPPAPPVVAQPGYNPYAQVYVQPSHIVPPYLLTPEPHHEGESLLAPLFREILRGIFKSIGQTFSNFWDTRAFRKPQPPPQAPPK